MDNDEATAAKKKRRAAAKKKKRSKTAKLGIGLIPKMIMMVFSSITVLIAAPLSLLHHSVDGSGENASPTLPPTTSKSLLRRGQSSRQSDHHRSSNVAVSPSFDSISSPVTTVTPPPALSSNTVSIHKRDLKSDKEASASSTICLDTPNWKDSNGAGCDSDSYRMHDRSGCPYSVSVFRENTGQAEDHCCTCGGGIRTCEDFISKCQKRFNSWGVEDGVMSPLCEEAEACSCGDEDHNIKVIINDDGLHKHNRIEGLYNECKCNFWSRICKDSGEGVACDYAAEYCCGDYNEAGTRIFYLNSPTCYCDFFNYAQREFGHTLRPKALNVTTEEYLNPCDLLEERLVGVFSDEERTRSREVDSLVAIYEQTNGQNWTSNAGWMDDAIDHCQWYGVSCNTNGFVTGIDLRDNNLVGSFPVYTLNPEDLGTEYGPFLTDVYENHLNEITWFYSKYGLANLYFLQTVDLADNKLTGTIDFRPLYNLYALTHFDVSGNQLSGEVDVLTTPSIAHANFSNNLFTSKLSFKMFKRSSHTLRSCDVSNNNIQNDATALLENIPSSIERFLASNNDIYGHLPASLNIPKLRQFDMSFNALSGTLPEVDDSMMSLQQLDISNQRNGFTGSIPQRLLRLQFLKTMNIAGNKLSGTIPPDGIGNMAMLEEFDASNNRLSGQIPPHIGKLVGALSHFGLANNKLSGIIPYQVGQLQDASIFLKGNSFDTYASAPLSLCTLLAVKESDIADDVTFCPVERNALSDFYDLAKGAEWTNATNWKDEYLSHCDWHGVKCVGDRVTELRLVNNGLSGRLSDSIGNLTSMEVLDLSDNDIKGSIPREIGLLSRLTYLRLSYNAFTGEAPAGLTNLTNLQLLQLQSNRITGMPNISRIEDSIYKESAFVAGT